MSLPRQLNPFGEVDLDSWRAKVLADLKGKPLSSLDRKVAGAVHRKVLYTREDLPDGPRPAAALRVAGQGGPAAIAPCYGAVDPDAMITAIELDAQLGAHAALADLPTGLRGDALSTWIKRLPEQLDPVWIVGPLSALSAADFTPAARGLLNPLGRVRGDEVPDWAALAQALDDPDGQFDLRLDLCWVFDQGADCVEELAQCAAALVYLLRQLESHGTSPRRVASRCLITCCLDTDFFVGLAKLRVMRQLWTQILGACGVDTSECPAQIHARAGLRSWAARPDAMWGNLLRGCTQSFSAALGGADWISTPAFDGGRSPEARRMATNTQVILREESFANEVHDAAAGSFYLERLGADLREAAWERFGQIEAAGGYAKQFDAGGLTPELAKRLQEQRSDVEADLATAKRVMVGVNRFVSDDAGPQLEGEPQMANFGAPRFAEAFEAMRARGAAVPDEIALLCAGELRHYKARADFARDSFAAAGLTLSEPLTASSELLAQAKAIVLCAADGSYGPLIESAEHARAHGAAKWIGAVTRPGPKQGDEAQLEQAVDGFVHLRADMVETFSGLIDALLGKGQGASA